LRVVCCTQHFACWSCRPEQEGPDPHQEPHHEPDAQRVLRSQVSHGTVAYRVTRRWSQYRHIARTAPVRSENLTEEEEKLNWFSALSALRIYGNYLSLDVDTNGMLTKSELMRYGSGTLTSVFVDRVFEECHTYDGEMDYKTFLDFAIAMENKDTPQALQYFFRLLDIRKQGGLDKFTINYFFRAILSALRQAGHELVNVEDVQDEIFDMAKPKDKTMITLQDLIDCKVGGTIVSMLTDMVGFWQYDNREELKLQDSDGPA
jgi:serine/threonine-protein phosphatase 2A regulatory subunit B''